MTDTDLPTPTDPDPLTAAALQLAEDPDTPPAIAEWLRALAAGDADPSHDTERRSRPADRHKASERAAATLRDLCE